MNAAELRGKSEAELRDELLALRREQFNLRMQAGVNPDAVRSDRSPLYVAISRGSKL